MKNSKKPVVAPKNQSNNKDWKPIRIAICSKTGRVVHLDDVRNANA